MKFVKFFILALFGLFMVTCVPAQAELIDNSNTQIVDNTTATDDVTVLFDDNRPRVPSEFVSKYWGLLDSNVVVRQSLLDDKIEIIGYSTFDVEDVIVVHSYHIDKQKPFSTLGTLPTDWGAMFIVDVDRTVKIVAYNFGEESEIWSRDFTRGRTFKLGKPHEQSNNPTIE